ncbi:hypothetical protein A3J77_00220 [Candidatus Wolfebacteria bacterium RBG_13_41_7]|uniref:Rod shape-determining protein MreD n=1 Tax=Candidatus Wolfebacteria bacterium RBG_13_41_7 TaxID=1802554 RepID=A0A1F8DNN0_9BACT|nr:MAG: hypothetical protein A3J77_00220 [Candidatus Wolfebacteria bacterium RBG_13_41_7]
MKFFSLVLSVGVLSFIQSCGFSVFGIVPNLALAAVVASAFFAADLFEGIFLVLLSALILKFGSGFESGILAFALIGAAAVVMAKFIPWRYFVGNLTAIIVAVLLFYAFLNPELILSLVFVKELFLDIVASSLIFAFLYFLWQDK